VKFSLILATVGRVQDVYRFLESLDAQTYRDFELVVVDQNEDDRLVPILQRFQSHFPICHLRYYGRGLSRARNEGLKSISGDIVAFPDDDCLYPPNLLEKVARWFAEHPERHGLTGRSVTDKATPSSGRWDRAAGDVDRYNVWRRGISFTIFLRKKVVETVGSFDEKLGVGAGTPWGSAEETDYLIRALEAGFRIFYDPTLTITHPDKTPEVSLERVRSYGRGMGYVLRKHSYPMWYVLYYLMRPLGGVVLAAITGRFRKMSYHWNTLLGRLEGYYAKGQGK